MKLLGTVIHIGIRVLKGVSGHKCTCWSFHYLHWVVIYHMILNVLLCVCVLFIFFPPQGWR